MKKTLIVLPIILLLATGCQLNNPKTSSKTNIEKNQLPQASKNQVYTNTKYGYTLNYNPKWRLAKKYSIYIGELQLVSAYNLKTGCLDPDKIGSDEGNKQMQNLQNCLANNPYLLEMNNAINNYESNWRAETAETVIFTDLNQTEEDNFISTLKKASSTFDRLDIYEHSISIFPYKAVLYFQKEEGELKNKNKYFYLSDGTKAYEIDRRFVDSGDGDLKISIPHKFSFALNDGNVGESLILQSNVIANSDSEADFINMAKSIKFE